MRKNDNKPILVGALLCTIGAAIIYAFKWAKFFFMSASIWEVAEKCGDIEKYLGMEGYKALSYCIYGGAILALIFLTRDAYLIAKPLLNSMNGVNSARKSGAGRVLSILFTIGFVILIYAANNDALSDASITMWPVVNAGLCIVAQIMIHKLNTSTDRVEDSVSSEGSRPAEPSKKTKTVENPTPSDSTTGRKCSCGYVCNEPKLDFCPSCGLPLRKKASGTEGKKESNNKPIGMEPPDEDDLKPKSKYGN